jgi:hypothetical protein
LGRQKFLLAGEQDSEGIKKSVFFSPQKLSPEIRSELCSLIVILSWPLGVPTFF